MPKVGLTNLACPLSNRDIVERMSKRKGDVREKANSAGLGDDVALGVCASAIDPAGHGSAGGSGADPTGAGGIFWSPDHAG